jgi:intracellular sulfur oxidation DsrE/DsrF family protein
MNMRHLFILLGLFISFSASSQVMTEEKLKVVFQLTSSDTLVHKALVKQLNNLLTAAPNVRAEVVCHNNGISFLQSAVTKQSAGISELAAKGIDFVACENTMRDRKIKKEDLVDDIRTVPAGLVEIILKQKDNWAYIKAGF